MIIQKLRKTKLLNINRLYPADTNNYMCVYGLYSLLMFKSFTLLNFWMGPYQSKKRKQGDISPFKCKLTLSILLFPDSPLINKSPVIRQKGESQNGCFKKTKHAKFSEKQTFLTPWYVRVRIRG